MRCKSLSSSVTTTTLTGTTGNDILNAPGSVTTEVVGSSGNDTITLLPSPAMPPRGVVRAQIPSRLERLAIALLLLRLAKEAILFISPRPLPTTTAPCAECRR